MYIKKCPKRYSGGRGGEKVEGFEDKTHGRRHLYDLTTHQAKLLVVVQHSVHALDPYGVYWTVEDQPFAVGCLVGFYYYYYYYRKIHHYHFYSFFIMHSHLNINLRVYSIKLFKQNKKAQRISNDQLTVSTA